MRYILLFIGAVLLYGCTNPLDQEYRESNSDETLKALKSEISDEDAKLLAGYLVRAELTKKSVEGMTYRQIIEDAKKLQAQRDAQKALEDELAEKARKELEAKNKILNESLTAAVLSKEFIQGDYQGYNVFTMAFENNSEKEIRAVKGQVLVTDLFDKPVIKFGITYDEKKIQPGGKAIYEPAYDYNRFRDQDISFKNKGFDDLKFIWTPEAILFSDGTKLD